MECIHCQTEMKDDDVQINGFNNLNNWLDIQLVCPNQSCGKTMSHFVKDDDWSDD